MNRVAQIIARLRTREGLIAVAAVLIVLNIGRLATNQYLEYSKGIDSKKALLGQYQISTKNIESMRVRMKQLENKKKKIDSYMFKGDSRREITSAMQIKIQEILGKASLTPESLRPSSGSTKDKDKQYGEVSIKVRITGNLENFLRFLSELYKLNYLFKIDNFTIKPYKNTELKIFIELKGFYILTKDPEKKRSDK